MKQIQPVMTRLAGAEQNRERLESLGTMAAGLAHELNNPAAAVKRAASDLADALDVIGATLGEFVEAGIERAVAEQLLALQREALARAEENDELDSIDAADAEDAMLERLEACGVDEPWRLAEPLAAAGVDEAWLTQVHELAGPATGAALRWVAASLDRAQSRRPTCSTRPRAWRPRQGVKAYAYMDRGELVQVDVHEGLKTTLVMLGHKIKHTSIDGREGLRPRAAALTVRGSELNQVWTNLIDNAIDAIGETGTLTISTARDAPCVRRRDRRRRPGHPGRGPATVLRPVLHDQGRWDRARASASTTARRIVESATPGRSASTSGPAGTDLPRLAADRGHGR